MIRVEVEACFSGNNNHSWRLTLPNGARESISNPKQESWKRKQSIEAKDMLCALYGFSRSQISFDTGRA